jgi:coatomer subunit beta
MDNCTLLISPQGVLPTASELTSDLESTDVQRKISGLKKAITLVLSGEDVPRALMTVIRFCITVEDHSLQVCLRSAFCLHVLLFYLFMLCLPQKLLMLYWEVARKHDAAGKLLPEMILVW